MAEVCTLWHGFDCERPEDEFWALGKKQLIADIRNNLSWEGIDSDEFDARVKITATDVVLTPLGVLDLVWRLS